MSKKLLWGIIVALLITNIATLLLTGDKKADSPEVELADGKIASVDVVATVADEEITYEAWALALRENYGEQQLKELIDKEVVQQLVNEKGIEVNEKLIERELAYLISMHGPLTEEAYAKEEENWRDEVIYQSQLKLLLSEGHSIPEEQLEDYYEEYQDQYNFKPAMQLSHILVQNRDTAEKVHQELEAGASFDLLAKEYSLDEESRSIGGYLGFIHTDSLFFPNGYEEVVAEVGEHAYSAPFAADNGIAIVYVHQILPGITLSYEEVKDYMESELILHEQGITASADLLWEDKAVDWIYE